MPANLREDSAGGGHRAARSRWAVYGIVALGAALVVARSFTGCKSSRAPAVQGGAFVVEVVDAKGAPLADAEVEGLVDVNPGIVASTCCTEQRFAREATSESGRATLVGAPLTSRAFHFRAAFRDWPAREVMAGQMLGRPGVVRIVLGPAREVRGHVELGPDCSPPPGFEVSASPPETRAKVSADGSFVFKSLAPWASIWVYACNRGARFDLEVGLDQRVVIALPRAESP